LGAALRQEHDNRILLYYIGVNHPRLPMTDFVCQALLRRGLVDAYMARPPYKFVSSPFNFDNCNIA
jgi:hypothetical protein